MLHYISITRSIILIFLGFTFNDCLALLRTSPNFTDINLTNAILNYSPKIDTDNNGSISWEEADVVTSLDLSSKNISDLTGMGYFHYLTNLNISNNNLAIGDLNMCRNLTSLYAGGNKFTSLNISYLTSLTYLNTLDSPNLQQICINSIHLNLTSTWIKNNNTVYTVCNPIDGITINNATSVNIYGSYICQGANGIYASTNTIGGVWSSSNPYVATIDPNGVISGLRGGSAKIIYTVTSGLCSNSTYAELNVWDAPSIQPIEGISSVCITNSTELNNKTVNAVFNDYTKKYDNVDGIWSSSNPNVATITPSTKTIDSYGIVRNSFATLKGIYGGITTIAYSTTNSFGCTSSTSKTITVPNKPLVNGNENVCLGKSINLTTDITGGFWSSSNINVATVNSTGDVYGVSAGTTTVNLTATIDGCIYVTSKTITVFPLPVISPISGTLIACVGKTIKLTNTTLNGTWSSTNPNIAAISTIGDINALSYGTCTISYAVSANGCNNITSKQFTVNPLPAIVPIQGPIAVCVAGSANFSTTTTGGNWKSSNTAIATVSTTGVVKGIGSGSATITYSLTDANKCANTSNNAITVIAKPNITTTPSSITACSGANTTITATGANTYTWLPAVTNNLPSGESVTAKPTVTTTYTVTGTNSTTTCANTKTVTIIVPTTSVSPTSATICLGGNATLIASGAGTGGTYTWTPLTGLTGSGATVTASPATTTPYTVTGKTVNNCISSKTVLVTVNPKPSAPSLTLGSNTVCYNEQATVNVNYGSGNSFVSLTGPTLLNEAGAGFQSGFAKWGLATTTGDFVLTVKNSYSCSTSVNTGLTVNPKPIINPIVGNTTICTGAATTLTNTTTNGTWSSSNPAIATVNASGIVNGISAGNAIISYAVTNNYLCTSIATSEINVSAITTGMNFNNPISIGILTRGSSYTNTQNNTPTNCFINDYYQDYGQASDDIVYSFTLDKASQVSISHCNSELTDTYLHLFDATKANILSVDDDGASCSGRKASLSKFLNAGTYYVMSEGYGNTFGNITTEIKVLDCDPGYVDGGSKDFPFYLNIYKYLSCGFNYSKTINTADCFVDRNQGPTSPEAYFLFQLDKAKTINISTCNSDLKDTYLSIIDYSGKVYASNDDGGPLCNSTKASITQYLEKGDYYIVVEGFGNSIGSITLDVNTYDLIEPNIPDPYFLASLKTHLPQCFRLDDNVDKLDKCYAKEVTTIGTDDVNIKSIEGIHYFENMQYLFLTNSTVSKLPTMPTNLKQFWAIGGGPIESISPLPNTVELLQCMGCKLGAIPSFPPNVKSIDLTYSEVSSIPDLPTELEYFGVRFNYLKNLPVLPLKIKSIDCRYNCLKILPQNINNISPSDWLTSPQTPDIPQNTNDPSAAHWSATAPKCISARMEDGNEITDSEQKQLENIVLVVIPNPATDFIQVNLQGTKVLYNTTGIEVIRTEMNQIDISNLPSGIYHLQLQQTNSSQKTSFVKR